MNPAIVVNGISLTPDAQNVLKYWQNPGSSTEKSAPERYVEYINDVQDCLTRIMLERGLDVQDLAMHLTNLICIKDDLKLLIPNKPKEL